MGSAQGPVAELCVVGGSACVLEGMCACVGDVNRVLSRSSWL
jgi:hypothetical protein